MKDTFAKCSWQKTAVIAAGISASVMFNPVQMAAGQTPTVLPK
jgi:hypothetical protein